METLAGRAPIVIEDEQDLVLCEIGGCFRLQVEWSLFALERPNFSKLSVDREIGIKRVNAKRLQFSI
jgi:hypothetical protein